MPSECCIVTRLISHFDQTRWARALLMCSHRKTVWRSPCRRSTSHRSGARCVVPTARSMADAATWAALHHLVDIQARSGSRLRRSLRTASASSARPAMLRVTACAAATCTSVPCATHAVELPSRNTLRFCTQYARIGRQTWAPCLLIRALRRGTKAALCHRAVGTGRRIPAAHVRFE